MIDKNRFYKLIGQSIKELRTYNNLSQQELAQKMKLTRSSLAQIESGVQAISLYNMYVVANTFDKSLCDLVKTPSTKEGSFDLSSKERLTLQERNMVTSVLDKIGKK